MRKSLIVGMAILVIVGAIVAFNLFYREEKIPVLTENQIKNGIVFVSGGNILIANVDGSNLTAITQGSKPTFSPDRKKLAFLSRNEIYLIDFEKGSKVKLCDGVEFKFSPDSQKLAFILKEEKRFSLNLIDLTTQKILKLTEGWESINRISWSPDGKRIAFGEVRDTQNGTKYIPLSEKIFIINTDGTNLIELIEGREPVWSPKEEKIAFVKWYGVEKEVVMELFVIDLATKSITKIAKNANFPSWSPDGRKIAFIGFDYKRNEYGNIVDEIRDIFVFDIETGNLTKLTKGNPTIWIFGPLVWSPDGKSIAFTVEPKFGGDTEIYLVNIEDKSIRNISNNPGVPDTDPCFPPP